MQSHFYPAKVLSYNKQNRTCQIHIQGLTDGLENGLTATIAYPVGDDDKDTDRYIDTPADCWVFFEGGDIAYPVVAFFRSHKAGVITDIRRIRQQNIELLGEKKLTMNAQNIDLTANRLTINAQNIQITGNLDITGNTTQKGVIRASDVWAGVTSLLTHIHGVLANLTTPPK